MQVKFESSRSWSLILWWRDALLVIPCGYFFDDDFYLLAIEVAEVPLGSRTCFFGLVRIKSRRERYGVGRNVEVQGEVAFEF